MREPSSLYVIVPGFGEPHWDHKVSILQKNCLKLTRNFSSKNIRITVCQYTLDKEIPIEIVQQFNLHIIKEKGIVGNFIKRHATPEQVSNYSYVMIVLDDVEISDNFSFPCIEEYFTDLGLDLVSPSLTKESPSGYLGPSPIHTNSDEYDVILLELCELFLYVFKSSAYSTYYQYVCHDNPWMWGMESMIYKKMGLTIGILNKITMIHHYQGGGSASNTFRNASEDRNRYLQSFEETLLSTYPNIKHVGYKITKIKKSIRTLVLYVFHEYNDRVEFFIKHALFFQKNTDFLIICNDEHLDLKSIINIPSYVRVLQRPNKGFDFGGWSEGLLRDDRYKAYECFLFINSSAIGPYRSLQDFPKEFYKYWTENFIDGLEKDDIAIFGSTINTFNYFQKDQVPHEEHPLLFSHVQSYIFCMKRDTLDLLIQKGIFSMTEYMTDFQKMIEEKEIGMSRIVLDHGKNIGCLMRCYKGVDFRFKEKKPVEYTDGFFVGDVMYPEFVNKLIFPDELIFIKENLLTTISAPFIPTPST
jgi:hypothetical protein